MGPIYLLITLLFAASIVMCFTLYVNIKHYKNSGYYAVTHNGYFKTHMDKGLYGEYLTYKYLISLNGQFLFNIYLPKDNAQTTEIDVLLIHESGIYVFESKNYSGWIFGNESQRTWTQTLPSGRNSVKSRFYNPIMQNEQHIKWLKALLHDMPQVTFHSFILFSDRCTLKNIVMTEHKAVVIKRLYVLDYVKAQAANTGAILSEQLLQRIYERLYPFSQVNSDIKLKHIEYINEPNKQLHQPNTLNKQEANYSKTCPKCGKPLILRTAKKGDNIGAQFWGCSGYPGCRFTMKESGVTANY